MSFMFDLFVEQLNIISRSDHSSQLHRVNCNNRLTVYDFLQYSKYSKLKLYNNNDSLKIFIQYY